MSLRSRIALCAMASLLAAASAAAQEYPTKPVRIYHGFTPGGPVDIIARLVAQAFGERFGQQALVEGKPGAGGTVGASFVAKSEPDGYSLFLMASGHSTSPGLYQSLPYDAVEDFTMVTMLASAPFAVMTTPASPYATIQDLVQKAKALPGRIDSKGNRMDSLPEVPPRQWKTEPPSMLRAEPVMNEDSSQLRKSTASATSSAVPKRFIRLREM